MKAVVCVTMALSIIWSRTQIVEKSTQNHLVLRENYSHFWGFCSCLDYQQ